MTLDRSAERENVAARVKEPGMSSPRRPEDWPRSFEQHLNAGELEAAAALYESGAAFVPQSGEPVVGREAIRPMLAALIGTKARLSGRVKRTITVDDVAVLYTDWQGTSVDPSGKTVEAHYKAIEVLRRQPDGTWRLIVGDPNGRG
jgi:uncharacterized protein (TIGR02246 family)